MKLSQRNMFAKTFATGLAFLSSAALADTWWCGAGTDSDFYNRDNWINWWDANYVFGGGKLGDLPADGSYVTFTNAAAIAQGLWIENANKGGVEWSLAENAEEGAGLTITNSLTIGTGKAGQLTINGGEYLVRGALNVASGLGTDNDGPGKSTLTLTNCTMTVGDGVFISYGANGANGEVLVKSGAVLNSTASSGDKFSVCKSGNGHHNTKGTLTIDGGTVNVASTLYTCQESGTGDITINSGALNVSQNSYLARGYYNSSTSTLTMNGGTFWTGGNLELASMENRNAGTATLNMNGGAIDVGGSIYWGGTKSGANVTVNMKGGSITATNHIEIAAGGGSTVNVTMDGGSITSMTGDHLYIANNSGSTGNVMINDGKLESTTRRVCVGRYGTGTLTVNGGEVTWGDQLMVACEAASTGTLNVNGGTVAKSDSLIQVGLNGTGYFNMTGGETICSGFRLASDRAQAVGTATVSGGTLTCNSDDLYVANNGTGTFNLNGGVVVTRRFYVGSGTGTLNLNGGVMKTNSDRGDFIWNDPSHLTVNICAGGAVFDTAGNNITVPATLNNADGLEGNGMIWKKGLGTLTISSSLDLERTFKFTIDGGVGPIALTGSNTLGAGDKITVEIDPVNAETNVAYTVMSGLGELTMDDIVLAGTDFYSYTGEVTDGTLSVTLQYGPTAPITARYDNGAWGVYNYNNELIPNGTATNLTTYVFNGSEPSGALATIAAEGRKILLESGTIAIDSEVLAGYVAVADGATVTISGSDAVSFAVDSLVNNGTLVVNGEITLDAPLSSGTISIADDAVLHLAKTQAVAMPTYIAGTGEIIIEGGVTLTLTDDHVNENGYDWAFKNFAGTLTLAEGSVLSIETGDHNSGSSIGNNATLKMAGGTVAQFSRNNGGSNNERIMNLIIEDNTVSAWTNSVNRWGSDGCVITIEGNVTGGGTLQIYTAGTGDSNRGPIFSNGLLDFTGEIQILHGNCRFPAGIKGGTVVLEDGTHIRNENGNAIAVDNATLVLKGNQGEIRNESGVQASGTYTIGADATLGVAENATVEGITFVDGATLEMLDGGALSDTTQTYVALTSKTPISGPKPTLVQSEGNRGKWKLSTREVTENETTTYELYAQFVPPGFVIIIQ